ncbi:MAG: hypothetical protein BM564_12090 [Bacteroidetes bacterium MedPE-SWsnd-G2]|nr:MAG: hypothetical protein BM564_12090 [Bacteroidetes bacterium MedPE-SWsnd-G2]
MNTPNYLHAIGIRRAYVRTIYILITLLSSSFNLNAQLAFPTAVGAGAYATGGRGGAVIHVTNLNNSGPGSFREAFTTSGPRIIVFDVSGTINLLNSLTTAYDDVTIAGQTAPEGGITFTGDLGNSPIFEISGRDNMIFRHIRVRPEFYNGGSNADAFQGYHCTNIIVDHCSVSWGGDECLSFGGNTSNISVQNSILAESKTGSIMGNPSSPQNAQNMSMVGNLFFQIARRHPNTPTNGRSDIINNVIWGYRYRTNRPADGHPLLNEINNYYITDTGRPFGEMNKIDWEGTEPQIYSKGNLHLPNTVTDPNLPNNNNTWTAFGYSDGAFAFTYGGQSYYDDDQAPDEFFTSVQHPIIGQSWEILTAEAALEHAKTDVGSNKSLTSTGSTVESIDPVDDFYITHVNNGTMLSVESGITMAGKAHYEDFLDSVSSTPLNARPDGFDSDNDGMPDDWELMNGLNPNDPSDRNIVQNDGYTNLEYYLNFMSLNGDENQIIASEDVEICNGEETTLTVSGAVSYLWTPGDFTEDSILVSPESTTVYTVTGTHEDGSESIDTVEVTVNDLPEIDLGENQTICFGESTTLVGPEADSYLWSTGETTQSISISPNEDTIYSLEITVNDCSDSDDIEIFVSELPDINAGSDQTISLGESITLQAVGGDNYVWSTGEETAQIEVSPIITTTYTVTGTINSCENTDTVTVFVEETINADAGEDVTICNGASVSLTASGGDVYLWSTGEETATIVVSPNFTTMYSVTVSNTEGTASDIDDVEVFVDELPVADAGEDVEICEGASVILTAQGSGEFLWSTGETTQSIAVQPDENTIYTVTVSQNDCEDQDEVMVTVNEIPELVLSDDITIASGDSTVLNVSGAESYLWDTGATTSSISVSPIITSTYSVSGFNGACEVTDTVTVFVDNTVVANAGEDVTICQGEPVTLIANGGVSYLWSTGETSQSIIVTPENTTIYEVTVFNASQTSSDSDEVEVFVNQIPEVEIGDDVEICEGNSVILTAQGQGSILWSTGETTTSIEVSPESTSIYSVILESNGCSAYDEIEVVVNEIPGINAGENQTINAGNSAQLIASGGESYTWSNGMNGSSITVSPIETTTYIVTGYSNGCENTDAVTVFVETPLEADAGPDVDICEGYETVLTAYGGSSYLWSTGETTQSIVVNPMYTETYSVTVYEGNNQASDDVVVNVNQNPELILLNSEEELIIDNGEYVTLSVQGADSYLWSNGATQPNIAVNPSSTTTYSVTGYINNCSSQKQVTVIVKDPVIAYAGEDVTICRGESTLLTATGGVTYLWSTGATTASIEVTPDEMTEYSVRAFDSFGDYDDDEVMVYVDECQSLGPPNDALESALDVYPNPTTGIVNVRIKGYKNLRGMYLYDISGKLLYSESFENPYSIQQIEVTKQLDLSRYQAGVYLLQLVDGVNTITKKVVVAN